MDIRRNDTVMVTTGKDRGKRGKVRVALPGDKALIVEGVNMIKRHVKPRPGVRQAGIISREAPLGVSKVMLVCSKCDKPTRVGHTVLEDGRKVRVCRKCKEVID
ncbi:MAG: 50S ribosomal protein L24 [Chloroflexi bacterium]|nr:50S ribosomal protein L24 [Chloroflexota bacterium]